MGTLSGPGERGAGLVEYVLLLVFVAAACVAALRVVGPAVADVFNGTGGELEAPAGG